MVNCGLLLISWASCAYQELSDSGPGSVTFLDFADVDFDNKAIITSAHIGGVAWEKSISIALDDFLTGLNPEMVAICKGDIKGNKRKNFDASIYNNILVICFLRLYSCQVD
ncbi:MAG: hypothetical protein M2R45_03174 [Verrucomicrobia subdivision 3 bacterium]|nr:hypothetical protein [Limisphaerales bacterium]MCS1417751.1 hypothetical protein [Limisphaerales bacterium]